MTLFVPLGLQMLQRLAPMEQKFGRTKNMLALRMLALRTLAIGLFLLVGVAVNLALSKARVR